MGGYPPRFRAAYGEAIVEAFAQEIERVRRRSSAAGVVLFWAWMAADLVASVAITRSTDAWRHVIHIARLLRGSTGFTAAAATLLIIPVWAWSRFATYTPGHARDATLTFCVSALHAAVIWAIGRFTVILYSRGAGSRMRAMRGMRYTTVRRARLVARLATMSVATFVVAAMSEAHGGQVHAVLLSPAASLGYWAVLGVALAALVGVYFAVGNWLQVRKAS